MDTAVAAWLVEQVTTLTDGDPDAVLDALTALAPAAGGAAAAAITTRDQIRSDVATRRARIRDAACRA